MYLYFWGQDIHVSDFLEKHPKNADLFFSSENWRESRVFFNFFYPSQIDQKLTQTSST